MKDARLHLRLLLPVALAGSVLMVAAYLLLFADDRVAEARRLVGNEIRVKVEQAGAPYPPKGVLLRAFKREKELEVWVSGEDGRYCLIDTLPIAAASGKLGPKRREGDFQVPEGFYRIDAFNPKSRFHLSMRVNYPNASDRVRGKGRLGGDIYIHGNKVSIGCLAMTDPVIRRLYLLAFDSVGPRNVHIFPARLTSSNYVSLVRHQGEHKVLWSELKRGYDAFEKTRKPPRVRISKDGRYLIE